MQIRTLTAETIAAWERQVGPTPIHGVELGLPTGGIVEPHHHPRGQIMFAASGVVTVTAANKSWVLSGSRAIWVPEQISHHVAAPTNAVVRNLQVSRTVGPHLPAHISVITVSPLFRELLTTAVSGPNCINPGTREEKVIELLLLEFQPQDDLGLEIPVPADRRLRKICAALLADPSDNRTLDEWAEIAGGCTRTLGRLFLRESGMTFAHWRRQVRLLDAMIRLNQGQPVTTVALDAGYETPSAFIEMFRRVTGKTPGQYVQRYATNS